MKKRLSIALILVLLLCTPALAHSGRTDSNGGHYNHSTGRYHYHHGYPAHQHTNGICPYDFDDQTGSSSGSSSGGASFGKYATDVIISNPPQQLEVGHTRILRVSLTPADVDDSTIHWTVDDPSIVSVSKYGTLTALATGTAEVTATAEGGAYTTFRVTVVEAPAPSANTSDLNELLQSTMYTMFALTVFIALVFVVCRFITRRQKAAEEKRLRRLEAERKEEEELQRVAAYREMYAGRTALELAGAPKNVEIGSDDLPRVIGTSGWWGEPFTFYVSRNGHAYHSTPSCSGAHIPIHAYWIRDHRACKRCRPSLPDLKWYREYLKIKRIKEKYNITDVAEETGDYWTTICVGLDEYGDPVCKTVYANNPEELRRKVDTATKDS